MAARSPISSVWIELLEAAVWAELHGRFGLEAGSDVATVKHWGKAAALASRVANIVAVNRAIGFGFERPLLFDQLSEIRAFYREQGKARWFVECSPHATIDCDALVKAGGVPGGHLIKLVADLDRLPAFPTAQVDVIAANESDGALFMDLVGSQLGVPEFLRRGIVTTIGQPGWYFYFAISSGRPIAGAAMFIEGDGAWLGLAGTLPEYRNQGAQSALLLRRISDAKDLGCRWVSAETFPEAGAPNPSLRNMKRFGLREVYQRPWYRFEENVPPSST